jgi:hypothetical protein
MTDRSPVIKVNNNSFSMGEKSHTDLLHRLGLKHFSRSRTGRGVAKIIMQLSSKLKNYK